MTNAEHHKLVPYETTITHINLFELKAMHPTRVFVWRLHQQAEAALGAYWEWYFGDAAGWYPMRVQAKRLEGGSYSQLRTPHGVTQMQTLIKRAAASRMEPLDVFYNDRWPSSTPWALSCSRTVDALARDSTLAPARQVQAATSVLGRLGGGVLPIQTVPLHARLAVLADLADDDPRVHDIAGIVVVDNGLVPTFAV